MPTNPKIAHQINKKGSSLHDIQNLPSLLLIALENGQIVGRIPIDDMPNDKLLATIQCQELMGRTYTFELEEINGHS